MSSTRATISRSAPSASPRPTSSASSKSSARIARTSCDRPSGRSLFSCAWVLLAVAGRERRTRFDRLRLCCEGEGGLCGRAFSQGRPSRFFCRQCAILGVVRRRKESENMRKASFDTGRGKIVYWVSDVPDATRPWVVFLPGLTADDDAESTAKS